MILQKDFHPLKGSLEDLININLDKHDILSDKKVNLIERLEVLSDSQQVIIFVDELGKYLEYASSVNQDIMFLQITLLIIVPCLILV